VTKSLLTNESNLVFAGGNLYFTGSSYAVKWDKKFLKKHRKETRPKARNRHQILAAKSLCCCQGAKAKLKEIKN